MSIQQTKKQSDLEKRLKLIRQQVYGKESSAISYQTSDKSDDRRLRAPGGEEIRSDISYLSYDLLKIGILSSIAIGAQIILYYLKFF